MRRIHLDFETRSESDLRKEGGWNYSKHPTTEVLCLAYAIDDGEVELLTKEQIENGVMPFPISDAIIVAHNVTFEYMIYHNLLVKRFDYPPIPKENWRCTAAMCSVMGLPRSLDNASKALELPFEKDLVGKACMMRMCKPRKITKNNKAKWHETDEDFEILYKYCKQDVEVERAIDRELPDLIPQEQKVFHLDQKINYRGINIDVDAVDSAMDLVEQFTEQAENKVKELTGGELNGLSRRQACLTWIKGEGVHLPDFTKETVNEKLNGEIPTVVRKVLELRQQLSKTSIAKFKAFKARTDTLFNILYDTLVYHAASTGRWAGMGVQLHNLPRCELDDANSAFEVAKSRDLVLFEALYPDVLTTLSQMLRGCLIPREGYEFVGGDQNAIEVRVLFWLAGEKIGLEQYRNNEDLYILMAKKIFGDVEIDKMKRFVGKQTVLGCGYGMGMNGERFVATCRKHGVTVPIELAKLAVRTYREIYRAVVAYWKSIEDAVRLAIRNQGRVVNFGKLKMYIKGDFLYIQLPSGRCLHYHQPKLEGNTIIHKGWVSERNRYEEQRTWGGVFTENVVSGMARDLIVHGMFKLEDVGFDVLLTVHDEILTEVSKTDVCDKVKTIESIMADKPAWAEGIPMLIKGWKGERFK